MQITSQMVRELRERSGAALMECKKALTATDGDVEAAFDHLRKAGLKSADKRAGRSTAEGRVMARIADDGRSGVLVALTCETDFVAKTDDFTNLLGELCTHVEKHRPDTPESMLEQTLEGSTVTVGEAIKQVIGKLGENMEIGHASSFDNEGGKVGSYVHFNDKIGCLVSVTSSAGDDKLGEFVKQLGMHIAATRPTALTRDEVPAEAVEREKAVYRESDELKGKPADRVEKIIEGKLGKFFAGSVLLEQAWVHEPKQSVEKALKQALGDDAKIERFALAAVGG